MDLRKLKNLLGRYVQAEANETEKALVDAWYRSYQSEESKPLGETEKERVMASLQKNLRSVTGERHAGQGRHVFLYRIAAGIALLCVAGIFYYTRTAPTQAIPADRYQFIATSAGMVQRVVLPDGSVAWLNAASRMRMPSAFHGSRREIYLDEGEAFFEIRKDAAKPFVVHTAGPDVRVLGTSFNVRAYGVAPEIRVTVSTGRVSVDDHDRPLAVLIPNQQLRYDRYTRTWSQHEVDAGMEHAWREGDNYLEQASFDELALVFRNTYGLNLKAGSPAIAGYQFTLRMQRSVPVVQMLKLINSIHNTSYRKEGNDIILQ
jgi:ferric-dicitrate binding protein FerR (iron transport regulator)